MPNYAPFAPFMTILRSMNVCSMTVKSAGAGEVESAPDLRSESPSVSIVALLCCSPHKTAPASPLARLGLKSSLLSPCSGWDNAGPGDSVNSLSLIESFNWQNKIALGEFRP